MLPPDFRGGSSEFEGQYTHVLCSRCSNTDYQRVVTRLFIIAIIHIITIVTASTLARAIANTYINSKCAGRLVGGWRSIRGCSCHQSCGRADTDTGVIGTDAYATQTVRSVTRRRRGRLSVIHKVVGTAEISLKQHCSSKQATHIPDTAYNVRLAAQTATDA